MTARPGGRSHRRWIPREGAGTPPSTHPTALGVTIRPCPSPPAALAHLTSCPPPPTSSEASKPRLVMAPAGQRNNPGLEGSQGRMQLGRGGWRSEPWQRGSILLILPIHPSLPPGEGAQRRGPASGSAPGLALLLLRSKHLQENLQGVPAGAAQEISCQPHRCPGTGGLGTLWAAPNSGGGLDPRVLPPVPALAPLQHSACTNPAPPLQPPTLPRQPRSGAAARLHIIIFSLE